MLLIALFLNEKKENQKKEQEKKIQNYLNYEIKNKRKPALSDRKNWQIKVWKVNFKNEKRYRVMIGKSCCR